MCVRRIVIVDWAPYSWIPSPKQNIHRTCTGSSLKGEFHHTEQRFACANIFFRSCVPIFLSHSHALSPHSLQHNRTLHTNIGLLRTHTCKQFAIYSICIQIELEQRDGNRPNALFIVNRFLASERQIHQPAIHTRRSITYDLFKSDTK